jgi:transcription initiation factor IIF auxiliary subunit
MKCLNDSGLKKLLIFLESRVPGITKVVHVEGNKLSIDKNIKLYAFVEDVVTEAEETVIPSNAPPLTPQTAAESPSVEYAAKQKEKVEQQREAIAKKKEEEELEDRLEELEAAQEANARNINQLKQTDINPILNKPQTPKQRHAERRDTEERLKVFGDVARALQTPGNISSI